MKTIKPIQGQTYMGYYYNDSNEEHVIEGICRKYDDEMILVNERGAWVPFEKLNENSYPTEPLAEDIIRETIHHYLYEDVKISSTQLMDLFENGSNTEISTLYGAVKEQTVDALESLGINPEDLDDETAALLIQAIEDGTDDSEEVPGLPDSEQPEEATAVEDTIEDTVDETVPEESGNIASELQDELDDELQLTESIRLTEISNEQYITLLNNKEQLHKIVGSVESKAVGDEASAWNWYKLLGPLNVNSQGRKMIIDKITVIANKAHQRALKAREATKDPAYKDKLPQLQKIVQTDTAYYEDLKKIQQYLATAPTPQEVAEIERAGGTKLTVDQLADFLRLKQMA